VPYGGLSVGLNAVVTGNVTGGNVVSGNAVISNTGFFWSNGTPYSTGSSTVNYATYFSGNLGGNILYDGVTGIANIQAWNGVGIRPISSNVWSLFEQAGQGGVGTPFGGTISPGPAVYTNYGGGNVVITTAGVTDLVAQSNIVLRSSSTIQTVSGSTFMMQVQGMTPNMSSNDRVRALTAGAEVLPQGGTYGSNQFQAPGSFTGYAATAVLNAAAFTSVASGQGNVSSVAGATALGQVAPTTGVLNVNYVTGLAATVGFAAFAPGKIPSTSTVLPTSTIEVARAIYLNGAWGNTQTGVNNQVINNLYGIHIPKAWENQGNVTAVGHVITNLKRSLQVEDAATELYSAGNVIIGGNLITTNSNAVTFNGPTTVNNTINTTGTATFANVISTNGYFWANGTPYSSGGGGSYGNVDVSSYLPHATGYTDSWQLPIGGNSQRPTFAANGSIRFNTDIGNPEWYNGLTSSWLPFSTFYNNAPASYSAAYLVVAGGGAGGSMPGSKGGGGGGGAGGLITGTATLTTGTTYAVTVGAGGAYAVSGNGNNGNDSTITALSLDAIGGGGGAGVTNTNNGGSGGSGGGGALNGTGGSGTAGQGNAGGSGTGTSPYGGAGGGGAGGVGQSASGPSYGGPGVANSITGSSVYYAGGGGSSGGAGGSGGGGSGGSGATPGTAGTANTGGGGGGCDNSISPTLGANGGSGVVILSVPTANYSGTTTGSPTITTSGSNTIITFTASGSYTA